MGSCLSAESRSPLPGSPSSLGVRKRKNSKKRFGSSKSSSDLQKIPGRVFANGTTEFASLFTQQGKKGTNQDAMLVWENFGAREDTVFCGVFDGHGPYGHLVARKVRDSLPHKLKAQLEVNMKSKEVLREISFNHASMNSEDSPFMSADDESRMCVDVEEPETQQDTFQTLKESFLRAFKIMDLELRVHTNVDCFCSGTTAVTLIKQGQDLVVGNVGDSRAVLGTRGEDNSLIPVQLTVDLKPNLPAEAERIRKCKGRVFALRDEPDVVRIWLPNSDSPGLAMARAFGDFCLKDYGLIAVPDVSYRRLTERDEFIVLASDGIWDVLTNKEVVEIIASAPSRTSAAKCLVEIAVRAWRLKYPTSKVDDCAVVCLFLDPNTKDLSCASNAIEKAEAYTENEGPSIGRAITVRKNAKEEEDVKDDEWLMEDWSALEGVSRVNTLLNLPRFEPRKC